MLECVQPNHDVDEGQDQSRDLKPCHPPPTFSLTPSRQTFSGTFQTPREAYAGVTAARARLARFEAMKSSTGNVKSAFGRAGRGNIQWEGGKRAGIPFGRKDRRGEVVVVVSMI
jgi:hypothetical protein